MAEAYQAIVNRILKQIMTLSKVTRTSTGSRYGGKTESTTDYSINGRLSHVTALSFDMVRGGIISTGQSRVHLRPTYTQTDGTVVTPEEGDYITADGIKFRILSLDYFYDRYGRISYKRGTLEKVLEQ